jgi:glycosyltransferase involved in cell wall biosynthesis
MTSLRVAFVSSIRTWGGGERWMIQTAGGLAGRGHRVLLLCRPGSALERRAEKEDLPARAVRFHGDLDPATTLRCLFLFARFRPDAVLVNLDRELRVAGPAARLLRVPAVVPRRGSDFPLKNKAAYRFAYRKIATHVIVNSRSTRSALFRNAAWLDSSRVHLIYNGIRPEEYDPAHLKREKRLAARADLGVPRDSFLIGAVGELTPRKGHAALVDAVAGLSREFGRVHLVIVGEGRERESLRALARREGVADRLHLTGFRSDVAAVLAGLDVFAFPSLREGFGYALIEAMAAALPVVASRTSSIPEIVEDGKTGYLVPPGDARSLAGTLRRLLISPHEGQAMGETGRRRVREKFTEQRMLDEVETLLVEAQQRRRAGS